MDIGKDYDFSSQRRPNRIDVTIIDKLEQLTDLERKRIKLFLRAFNKGLDLLEYQGHISVPLPHVSVSRDLVVNGTKRAASLEPIAKMAAMYPALHIDCSDDPASKAYADEYIEKKKKDGWSHDLICKAAMVETAFEEAYHFVDFTKGRLPVTNGQGLIPGYTRDDYYKQPHEERAIRFAEENLNYYFQSFLSVSPILYE